MRNTFADRRQVLWDALANAGLKVAGAASFGGTNLWLKGPDGMDSTALSLDLQNDSVLIEAGTPFFDNAAGRIPFFRLAYSSIPENKIETGVGLIAKRLASYG